MRQLHRTVRKARAAYRVLAPYGRPHRSHLFQGALATLVLVAARLAFPWPLRGLMEIVFHQGSSGRAAGVTALVPKVGDPVAWLVGAFVVIVLVWGVSESLQRLAFTRFAIGLVHDVRDAALARVSVLSDRTPAGDLISTVTGDTSRLKSGITSILVGLSRNGAFFLGVAVIVAIIDPVVGLVFLGGGLATAFAGGLGAAHSSRISRKSRERDGELADDLHRYLAGETELERPRRSHRAPDSKATRVEGLTTFVVHAILAASTCTILLLTIRGGRTGQLSPGAVFTVLAYILLMHNKTVGLGRSIVRAGRVLPSAKRIAGLVGKKPPRPKPGPGGRHDTPGGPPEGGTTLPRPVERLPH
ncbi:MAG: hypothetical protein QOI54_1583 [Actinomycetota bacterium]|jgi:ATP-binding cassette subfamily C protein|nr:hypothetical protein [Actinomycetota bacterium]